MNYNQVPPFRRDFDAARDPYTARNALGITSLGSGGGAPTSAEYITATSDATLTNERVLTDSATVTWDFSTPGQVKANTTAAGGNVSNSGTPASGQWARWVTSTTIEGVATASTPWVQKAGDTMTGDLIINKTAPIFALNGSGANNNSIAGYKSGLLRWQIAVGNSAAETGSDAGSDFAISRVNDAGSTILGTPLSISRQTGVVTIDSANLTGDPKAVTPATGDNDTSVATTAFVKAQGYVTGGPYQPLDADLTSWAGVTRAAGFDTFTATPSSANLLALMTTETGSGNLVFATSPTLVTPILGTPTSGTLTNCTGLPSILAANEATDTTCFPAFFTAASGELGPKTNAGLTFNSATGALAATSLTSGGNAVLTTANGQPLDADLTSWAGVTRAAGFDTFAATPSSANLATLVTNETGSGALVFATSPTLVTPALGTPSSGTLTSCTGLPSIVVANEATDTTCFPAFFTAATGELGPKTNANLTYNSSSGKLGVNCSTTFDNFQLGGSTSPGMKFSPSSGSTTLGWLFQIGNVIAISNDTTRLIEQTLAGTISFRPATNDIASLGESAQSWSDLFLATGGVINWGAGNATITHSTGLLTLTKAAITGTATNDSAATGQVGEYVESSIPTASRVALTSATWANVTSISLTAGDWDVWAVAQYDGGGTTTIQALQASLTTTSATPDFTQGRYAAIYVNNATALPWLPTVPLVPARISIAATTTIYLVATAVFGVSTCGAFGRLMARRKR